MKQKLLFVIALFLMFVSQVTQAQNSSRDYLVRATMGTSGSSENITANNKQYVVQQSIGQGSVVGTFEGSAYPVRQGFIQPNLMAKIVDLAVPLNLEASVYPNPFVESVSISFTEQIIGEVEVAVFDMVGRLVFSKSYTANQVVIAQFNPLPGANYILKVRANNKQFINKILKK